MAIAKLSLLAGAAVAAFALPAAASAADAPAAAAVQELVVTAEKREQNVRDVPQSVSVVTGAALELRRMTNFQDYIATIPGMTLVQGQPGLGRLVLRGINAGGVSATIGTYIDETPYGSVTGLANGAISAPDFDTFDMQRVEVLRGPQGTLYGASSLGGLLKFVTNPPNPGGFYSQVDTAVESTNSAPVGGSVRGVANIPLGDKMAVRGSAYWDNLPGYIDDPLRKVRNVNGVTYTGGRLSFLAKPVDNLTVRVTAALQDISDKGSGAEDVNRLTLKPLYGDLTNSRAFSPPNKINYQVYNATLDYDLGFADVTSATSYGKFHQDELLDASALLGGLLSAVFKQPLGSSEQQNLDQRKFTKELRLASHKEQFEWLVGGFFTREQNDLHQILNAISLANAPQVAPGLGGLETVRLKSSYVEYAFFANVDYHFTDRFDLSAGGRYSHNDQHDTQITAGPLVGPTSVVTGTSSEEVFTFSVAPKYKVNDDMTVYARVAKGYRPGGPNALQPLAPAAVPRTFQSDSTMNYEVGVKGDAGPTLSYELTAFYIDWSRIQLLANVQNFGVNTNGGSASSKGVEGSVTWAATHDLTLSANGAYVDATLDSATGPLLGGKSGDRLPFSSPFTGSIDAAYKHEVRDNTNVFAGATVQFVGRRRSDFNATFGQTSLPSYTTLDLRTGLEVHQYRLEIYAHNITDERGILNFGGVGSTPNGGVQLSLVRPRTVGVSLSASF